MPSPFPGMDPYLEGESWTDFHVSFNGVMRERLVESLPRQYAVQVERRLYLEYEEAERGLRVPDDLILHDDEAATGDGAGLGTATASLTLSVPLTCTLPQEVERREAFLTVRHVDGMRVVAVFETLSPANKRPGTTGRREYLEKRAELLRGEAHLVEIDLLRAGERAPIGGDLPAFDFYALVSHAERRPSGQIYPWSLPDPLPTIAVPLRRGDPDVSLDLQDAFATTYRRAGFDRVLKYRREPEVPFTPAHTAFARTLPGVLTDVPQN